MSSLFVFLVLSKMPAAAPAYPYPPANPCSNPVKCSSFRAMPLPGERQPRGPRR